LKISRKIVRQPSCETSAVVLLLVTVNTDCCHRRTSSKELVIYLQVPVRLRAWFDIYQGRLPSSAPSRRRVVVYVRRRRHQLLPTPIVVAAVRHLIYADNVASTTILSTSTATAVDHRRESSSSTFKFQFVFALGSTSTKDAYSRGAPSRRRVVVYTSVADAINWYRRPSSSRQSVNSSTPTTSHVTNVWRRGSLR